jgi:hypothetical protein
MMTAIFGMGQCLLDDAERDALGALMSAWPAVTVAQGLHTVPWNPEDIDSACSSENQNVGNWSGIDCLNGHINGITLVSISLGTLPAVLGDLAYVTELVFSENDFTGTIPPEMGSSNIRRIEILGQTPGLTGPIPSSWATFSNLRYLDLSGNKLNGSLPIDYLYQSLFLYNLGLWNNQFSGSISENIGQMFSLSGLYLSNNLLTGTVPESIGSLPSLEVFTLRGNALNVCPQSNWTMTSPNPKTPSNCVLHQQSVESCGCAATWAGCQTDTIPACPPSSAPAAPAAPSSQSSTLRTCIFLILSLVSMVLSCL